MKLNSASDLATFVDSVIAESVKSALHNRALQEKEKQNAASSSSSQDNSNSDDGGELDLFSNDDSGDEQNKPAPSKTMDDETEKLKLGNVEPKDIIEKLNSIRSGRSFKDEHVGPAMEQYVNSLSKAEKTALLAFLKGISQIVTGEVSGEDATEPDSNPADVQMQKGANSQKQKHIEPNVIKNVAPKSKPKQGTEDSSGPVPITPKKK
jgi:hypothetical protein